MFLSKESGAVGSPGTLRSMTSVYKKVRALVQVTVLLRKDVVRGWRSRMGRTLLIGSWEVVQRQVSALVQVAIILLAMRKVRNQP